MLQHVTQPLCNINLFEHEDDPTSLNILNYLICFLLLIHIHRMNNCYWLFWLCFWWYFQEYWHNEAFWLNPFYGNNFHPKIVIVMKSDIYCTGVYHRFLYFFIVWLMFFRTLNGSFLDFVKEDFIQFGRNILDLYLVISVVKFRHPPCVSHLQLQAGYGSVMLGYGCKCWELLWLLSGPTLGYNPPSTSTSSDLTLW